MVDACAECGRAFFAGEWKYCERCYARLLRENKELLDEITEYKREVNDLEEEISKLETRIFQLEAKLAEYEKIVMSEPKLWSKLVARKLTVH